MVKPPTEKNGAQDSIFLRPEETERVEKIKGSDSGEKTERSREGQVREAVRSKWEMKVGQVFVTPLSLSFFFGAYISIHFVWADFCCFLFGLNFLWADSICVVWPNFFFSDLNYFVCCWPISFSGPNVGRARILLSLGLCKLNFRSMNMFHRLFGTCCFDFILLYE